MESSERIKLFDELGRTELTCGSQLNATVRDNAGKTNQVSDVLIDEFDQLQTMMATSVKSGRGESSFHTGSMGVRAGY